jgi:hypothetical protein
VAGLQELHTVVSMFPAEGRPTAAAELIVVASELLVVPLETGGLSDAAV